MQLSELPVDQRDLINHSSDSREMIIKIQVDGKILNDCIQFKDYLDWYKRQFNIKPSHSDEQIPSEVRAAIAKHVAKLTVEKI